MSSILASDGGLDKIVMFCNHECVMPFGKEKNPGQQQGQQPTGHEGEHRETTVVGRIGGEPQYREVNDTSRPGQKVVVGNFGVAVHPNGADTVWYDVAVWDQKALELDQRFQSGELKKGSVIEVTGVVKTKTVPTRAGGTKEVHQMNNPIIRLVPPTAPAGGPQQGARR